MYLIFVVPAQRLFIFVSEADEVDGLALLVAPKSAIVDDVPCHHVVFEPVGLVGHRPSTLLRSEALCSRKKRWDSLCSHNRINLDLRYSWRSPASIQCALLGPIGPDIQHEILLRRRQPVGALVAVRRSGLDIDRERAIGRGDERL